MYCLIMRKRIIDRKEKIRQAELIWNDYLANRNKNTIELRRLLLDIVDNLHTEEKKIIDNIQNVNLKDEMLSIENMHTILKLVKNLDNIKNREADNSIHCQTSISQNMYGPDNPYPSK